MTNHVLLLKNPTVPFDPYRCRCESHGFIPKFVPLLNHCHYDRQATIQFLTSDYFVNNVPVFIITSQRAVEMFSDCLNDIDEITRGKIFAKIGYTVGPATFKVLQQLGFTNIKGGERAGNGLKLSEIVKKEVDPNDQIVFFTGVIRKDIIPRQLLEANFNLVEKVIYKTEDKLDIITNFIDNWEIVKSCSQSDIQWIIFFSPQGTDSIIAHLKEMQLNENIKIASIGPTTETFLLENNIVPHVVAAKPHADSLVESILKFQSSNL
jgi:uroporphyrinogen-III synthase